MNFRLICLAACLFAISDSVAQNTEEFLVKHFSVQIMENGSKGQLRIITLNKTTVLRSELKVTTSKEMVIFNGDKALAKFIAGEYVFNYDSMYNSLDETKSLSFWPVENHRLWRLEVSQFQLTDLTSRISNTSVVPKSGSTTSDLSIIAFVVIIGLMGHYVHYHRGHAFSLFDFFQAFGVRTNDEPIFRFRIFTMVTIKSMVLISLMTSYLLSHLFESHVLFNGVTWEGESLAGQTIGWLLFSAVVYIILLIKYQLITFNAALFSIKDVVTFQFYNGLRLLFMAVFTLTILKLCISLYYGASASFEMILGSLLLALFVRLLVGSYKLLSNPRFRIVPLFVYLCATEIMPFALAFFLLKK